MADNSMINRLTAWLRRRKAEVKIDKEWLRVQRLPIPEREALAEEVYRGWMNSMPEPLRGNIRFNEIDGSYSLEEYALKQARGYSGLTDWEPRK